MIIIIITNNKPICIALLGHDFCCQSLSRIVAEEKNIPYFSCLYQTELVFMTV